MMYIYILLCRVHYINCTRANDVFTTFKMYVSDIGHYIMCAQAADERPCQVLSKTFLASSSFLPRAETV